MSIRKDVEAIFLSLKDRILTIKYKICENLLMKIIRERKRYKLIIVSIIFIFLLSLIVPCAIIAIERRSECQFN